MVGAGGAHKAARHDYMRDVECAMALVGHMSLSALMALSLWLAEVVTGSAATPVCNFCCVLVGAR